ncbi:hypothetical protein CTI12_AA445280 [Artemisia annua]|uniref:Uncharacterized protein n=1 Tax=Artemisia annua TaxID=35608 RepID=A0A2U1LWT1_ARTAN|nr:hypothetical protein CTI12_AA445280 [Artemisia annua]
MDIWLGAVAAGAGYIAQHFKKVKQGDVQIVSDSSVGCSVGDIPDSPKPPLEKKWSFQRFSRRESVSKDVSEDKSEASTSEADGENGVNLGNYASSLLPGFMGSDGIVGDVDMGDLVNKPSTPRSRMSLRSRRARAIRPLSALESCLMAQVEMKDYTSSLFASPSGQTVRPFLVTDGSNVISRSGYAKTVQSSVVEKKLQRHPEEHIGSSDAMLLVCIGVSFGILYSLMVNKREVEKLNRLLKQKENLVLDLEDEIKMKDSLVMHELIIDDHKSQGTDEHSPEGENEESLVMKTKDDSFSKIEAELEAELEMLELNMTSSLERKISNLVELDPDFEPDVAQGELRADVLENTNQGERGSSSTTTIPSANYAVSPRELSLRLHEVLQFQLEERIKELEAEIESKRIQNHISWKDFSSSDAGDDNTTDEPVVLNLSGEALDAYNEACNVFAKLDESDEDGTPIYQMDDIGSGNSFGTGENEMDSDEDEMEKLLIKNIVEKARQGSPAILNAQRVLFSE